MKIAKVQCSDGEWRLATQRTDVFGDPMWVFGDGLIRRAADSMVRPVVVIDPEDREQVERLVDEWTTSRGLSNVEHMQAALREFIKPLPAEPKSLGAVVNRPQENGSLQRWVRGPKGWTNLDATGPYLNWSDWSDVVDGGTVEVLSEGVPS